MTTETQDYFPALLAKLEGDPKSARRLLAEAADRYARDPRPLLLLAAEFMHAQEVDRAEAAYIAALQRAPDFSIARFQLGLLQFTSARPAAAQSTWAPLDALPEKDPLRLFKTGLELLGQDRFDEARRFLREGIAQNKTNLPLNRDMQMVIDRMSELDGGGKGAGPGAAKDGTAAGAGGHFLVSTYGKQQ